MAEFDKLSSYIDPVALAKDTEFFLSQFAKVEDGAEAAAKKLKAAFGKIQGPTFNSKATIDEMKNLELTTSAYQKILSQVAVNLETLTKKQNEQLKTIQENYIAEETARQGAKQTAKLIETEIAQTVKLGASKTALAKTIAENNLQLKQEKIEMDRLARVRLADNNSREKAQAIIDLLIFKGKKLNLETEQGRRVNEAYNATIAKQNKFITDNADVETKRIKNIGNYSKSAQIIVDALEKERKKLEELEKTKIRVQNAGSSFTPGQGGGTNSRTVVAGFAGGGGGGTGISKNAQADTKSIQELDEEIAKSRTVIEGFARVADQPKFLNIAGKVGDANMQVRFFTKALIELEKNGLGDTTAAKALRKELAELIDQIGDTNAEIKALSSDTRGLDLFAGSVSFAADAFQTFAGAAVLAGASEEDAAEATKTLVAVQSVANGVKGIANELTTRGTAANKAYAFVQRQVAIVTDSSATSLSRFKAALITTGIGALIVGVGLLIANFGKLKEALGFTSKAQEAVNDTLKDYQEGAKTAIEQTNKVKSAFESAKSGVISKDEALKVYNETLGDTLGQAKTLQEAEDNYNKKAAIYIEAMGLRAQANALFAKSAEAVAKGTTAGLEDQTSVWDKLKAGAKSYLGFTVSATKGLVKAQADGEKETIASANRTGDALFAEGQKRAERAEKLTKDAGIVLDPKKDDKKTKTATKKADDSALKEALDLERRKSEALRQIAIERANEQIRINQSIVDNEKKSLQDKILAIQEIDNQQKALAAIELAKAIEDTKSVENGKVKVIKKTLEEVELAREQYRNKLNVINDKTLADQLSAQKAYKEKVLQEVKESNDKELQAIVDASEKEKVGIEERFSERLALNQSAYEAGKISLEEYTLAKAKIEKDYQKESLANDIKFTEETIKLMKLRNPEADVTKQLQDLAKLKRGLNAAELVDTKNTNAEKLKNALETIEKIKGYSSQVFDVLESAVNASITADKNKLQEQSDAIDKKKEMEIKAIEASTESEEDKANRIAIINARAAAQKEVIDLKQREIDRKKAQFDKARSIFNITLNTAQAVIAALTSVPPDVPLSIFNGIVGAAQLAVAIATPLPKFFRGKKKGEAFDGYATVNDNPDGRTSEVIEYGDGSLEFPNGRDVVRHIKTDDTIHPDSDAFLRNMQRSSMKDVARKNISRVVTEKSYAADMTAALEKQTGKIVSAINNKKELSLSATDKGMKNIWLWGSRQVSYVDQNTNWK